MTKAELRKEIADALKGMYWVPQDREKYLHAVEVETNYLVAVIEQYAQQGKEDSEQD